VGKPVIFLPEALEDARLAYAWYEENECGLGEDFYSSRTGQSLNIDIPSLDMRF
jgi:hypothetical protein